VKCHECEREITDGVITGKDAIALNKKLLNRETALFFCAACLAEYLEIPVDDLPDLVEQFKELGCTLFM
jgi:hypothetical protein